MRILIYSIARCGSSTLLNWVSKELHLAPLFEPFNIVQKGDARSFNDNFMNDFDSFQKMDNFVAKMIFGAKPNNVEIIENEFFLTFDKVIALYRSNLADHATSLYIAKNIIKNYFSEYNFEDVRNQIDDNSINQIIGETWKNVERLKNFKNCEIFTYEEIFEHQNHKRLLEYLGIVDPKHLDVISSSNRYRK
jgi:hypothetical protein